MSGEFTGSATELLPGVEFRPYQMECVQVLKDTRVAGETKALIHMATGLGKTITAALDLHEFLNEQPDARILFLRHRSKIIDQARRVFEEKLAPHNLSFTTFSSKASEASLAESQFTFATFQSMNTPLRRHAKLKQRDRFNPYDFDYVIVDEAHHATAETYLPTIQYFAPQFLLAMSATPDRTDDQDIRDYFGNEKFIMDLARGLSEGWLATPHYVAVMPEADARRMSSEVTGERIWQTPPGLILAETVADLKERTAYLHDPKILAFCNTIAEAEEFGALWGDGARAIHSKQSRDESDSILADFYAGNIRILASVDMVGEGVDVPDIDVVAFLRSTESEMVFLQQLGRGLRKTKTKNDVLVVDYVANYQRLTMLGRLVRRLRGKPSSRMERGEDPTIELTEGDGEIHFPYAEFKFAQRTIDLMKLYQRRRTELSELATLNQDDAISRYKAVWEKMGKYPTEADLYRRLGPTAVRFILAPFGGQVNKLYKAATGLPDAEEADVISMAALARETNSDYQRLTRYRREKTPDAVWKEVIHRGAFAKMLARQSIPEFIQGFREYEEALEISKAGARVNERHELQPDDWTTIEEAAADIGLSYVEMMRLTKEYGVGLRRVREPDQVGIYIHKQQLELLRTIQKEPPTLQ